METVTTIRVRWRGYDSKDIERAIVSGHQDYPSEDQALVNAVCMTQCCWHRAHEELLYLNPVRLRRDENGLVGFWVSGTGGWAAESGSHRSAAALHGYGMLRDPELSNYLIRVRVLLESWPLRFYDIKTQRVLDDCYRLYRSRPLNPEQLDKIADSLLMKLGEIERGVWDINKKGEG